MPSISKSALVPYTAEQMFEIVDDVEAYAEFLPWCGGSQVLSRDEDEVKASVEIAHSGIHKTFTTLNRRQCGKMIEMQLIDGPFKHLHGYWRFSSLGEQGCKVSLDLEYEFSNKLLGLAVGKVFSQIANTLVDSFCKRADALHGAS
ncbi:MAG: type II toxin-antitoxin system RatA family toxin [Gammaproteobacteria bacterium]|nr:type II toxin-antitoxin system RatA family toxin [Gammaproteobacteria bacterium]MDH5802243.1 type II toxin-antitoxin system RatA family toxin [Gammaproteobacteria bacterium]